MKTLILKIFLISILSTSLKNFSISYAQDKNESLKGLSQLSFDRKKKGKSKEVSIQEILKLGAMDITKVKNGTVKKENKSGLADSQNLAKEKKLQDNEIEDAQLFIVPKLKGGPSSDESSPKRITTEQSWKRRGSKDCDKIEKKESICERSIALKELLNRFTGDDNFYFDHCQKKCSKKSLKNVMQNMSLEPNSSIKMTYVEGTKNANSALIDKWDLIGKW